MGAVRGGGWYGSNRGRGRSADRDTWEIGREIKVDLLAHRHTGVGWGYEER